MGKQWSAVSIDFDTLGLLRDLSLEDKESQSAIVTRLIQEEVDRRGGIQVFEPREEILILKQLYNELNDLDHKSFVALARQQKQLMELTFGLGLVLDYMETYLKDPGLKMDIAKQTKEKTEKDWPETARMFGYNVLPVEEGGLGEYPEEDYEDDSTCFQNIDG